MKRVLKWLGIGLGGLMVLALGIAMGDRELRSMSDVARNRFAHFTDGEIRALHDYLRTLRSTAADEEAS